MSEPIEICPCCKSGAAFIFNKNNCIYYECTNCKTIFVPKGIDQRDMVGGGFELERNTTQNKERINRIVWLIGVEGKILDFGCGHGLLVKDCIDMGLNCDGYDKFNPDFNTIKEKKYDLISMVEVIEHTYSPFEELDIIREKLTDNGILYIETSFTDVALEEGIVLEDFFYINPDVGHCTIFSHIGLDLLMKSKEFIPLVPINRNVRLYQKAIK